MIDLTPQEAIDMLERKSQEVDETIDEIKEKFKSKQEYQDIIWELSNEIERARAMANTFKGDDREVYEYCKIDTLVAQLKHIQNEMSRKFNMFPQTGITVDQARAVPLLTILDAYNVKYDSNYNNRIRFKLRQNERTPSAYGYLDQNTFYDYGVCSGGSVIDLVMLLEPCEFKEALKILSRFV